ncbi:MAG: ATP-binding cassette domain-containing protein, partial [Oscillospiraceae bacterium]|nr:ATP-binding cassette domain-containing protein [Oscillospiraceae bacterium]
MKTRAFTKTYARRVVLTLPELTLPEGKITAVIGPNGSGKSTFAKVLAGIEPADDRREILAGVTVGYLPQKSFPFRMSTEKNI